MKCAACEVERTKEEETGFDLLRPWWHLKSYYGITGTVCPDCYELVSHDSYGLARHPLEYVRIKEKLK